VKLLGPCAGGRRRGRFLTIVALVCFTSFTAAALHAFAQPPQPSPPLTGQTAPPNPGQVLLDGRPVFEVRWGYKTFTPDSRAAHISERLKVLGNDPAAPRLTVQPEDVTVDVMSGENLVASVFDGDAKTAGIDKEQLAQQWASAMQRALDGYRAQHSVRLRIMRVLLGLLVIVGSAAALTLVRAVMRRLAARVEARLLEHAGRADRRVAIFLGHPRTRDYVARAFTAGRLVLSLVVLWFGLRLLFFVFPATRWLSELMHQSLFGPLHAFASSLLESLPSLIFVFLVLVVTWYVIRLVHFFFGRIRDRDITIEGFRPIWATTTDRLLTFGLIILGVLIAYPYIPGSQSPAFKGISLFLGVLVSLGSTGMVANLVTGISLTYVDAFEIGDLVKIGEVIGYITKMGILTTRVRTRKNEIITLPNSLVAGKEVVNYSKMSQSGLIIASKVGIGYDAPWRQVEGMLKLAAVRTSGVRRDPEPFVLELSLNTFDITYELNAYIGEGELPYIVLAALNRNILDAFNEFGVQIMTPAYVMDPRDAKVVPRDQWRIPPSSPSDSVSATPGPEPESGGSKAAD
jgi:small-conductance mechanosensitive channel